MQLNVRLPAETVEALRLLAEIEDVKMRDIVLEGVNHVIHQRQQDADWKGKLSEYESEVSAAFDSLRPD